MTCAECGCRVIGERKKGKYNYYHCTFTKGRKTHKYRKYLKEEYLSDRFIPLLKSISISESTYKLIIEGVKYKLNDTSDTPEKRAERLIDEKKRLERRLTLAYEDKLDGRLPESSWDSFQKDYSAKLATINSELESINTVAQFHSTGLRAFELLKDIDLRYKSENLMRRAELLKIVASNFSLDGENLLPVWKKPFFYVSKNTKRSNWLGGVDSNHQIYGPKP